MSERSVIKAAAFGTILALSSVQVANHISKSILKYQFDRSVGFCLNNFIGQAMRQNIVLDADTISAVNQSCRLVVTKNPEFFETINPTPLQEKLANLRLDYDNALLWGIAGLLSFPLTARSIIQSARPIWQRLKNSNL